MHTRNSNSRQTQRGVSLMEVMVGAALGMVCVIVIFQVVSLWEARTRTTSTGSDTQVSGTLAVFALEREIKLAGMGIGTATSTVAGCSVAAYSEARSPKTFTFPMAPVVITPKTDGTPDSIQVLYGNSPYFVDTQPFDNSTTTSKTSRSSSGFQLGDLMIVASSTSTDCSLAEVTGYAPADSKIIQHGVVAYTNFYTNANQAVNWNSAAGLSSAYSTGMLFSLGPNPSSDIWAIQNNVLTWTNALAVSGVTNQVSDGIINMKAQYGIDGYDGCAADTMIVSSGCGASGKGEWTTTAPTDWSKVRAVRIAILARSQQYEVDPLPTTAIPQPSWVDDADAATLGFGNPDAGTEWQHYRYRVYETIVPLRNMIWGTSP